MSMVANVTTVVESEDGKPVQLTKDQTRIHDARHWLVVKYPRLFTKRSDSKADMARQGEITMDADRVRVPTPTPKRHTSSQHRSKPAVRHSKPLAQYRLLSGSRDCSIGYRRSPYRALLTGSTRQQILELLDRSTGKDGLEFLMALVGRESPSLIYATKLLPAPGAKRSRGGVSSTCRRWSTRRGLATSRSSVSATATRPASPHLARPT